MYMTDSFVIESWAEPLPVAVNLIRQGLSEREKAKIRSLFCGSAGTIIPRTTSELRRCVSLLDETNRIQQFYWNPWSSRRRAGSPEPPAKIPSRRRGVGPIPVGDRLAGIQRVSFIFVRITI